MTATTLIPLAAWVLFFLYLLCKGIGWRTAFLATSILWGVSVTVLTELLSLATLLNRPVLAACWTVPALAAGFLYFRIGSLPGRQPLPALSRSDRLIAAVICGIAACTFVIAAVSPPNNWDSLTYHMTRVMLWIQHGNVAHFPTNNLRQIELNPWAEFAVMHLQMLSGGDYLANLVQWFSFAGCIIGVSLITSHFGGTLRGQVVSGLFAATLPMAILQASSTQNDLVVSFWLVCFIASGMISAKEKSLAWHLLMSCSLGLAILTKGTAYIYGLPFILWFFTRDVRKNWRQAVLKYLLLGGIVLALNLGHYQRNYHQFHDPLQSGDNNYSNGRLSAAVIVSNLSRNTMLHLLTPSDRVNGWLTDALVSLHSAIGIAIDDLNTTWPGTTPARLHFGFHEDHSGNPLHLLLFSAILVMLPVRHRFRSLMPYASAAVAGVILFCVMLRWQPWSSRLHLPLFMLFSPIGGFVVAELYNRWFTRLLLLFLAVTSIPYLILNYSRPVIALPGCPQSILSLPRQSRYFANKPEREAAYRAAAERIRNGRFRNIGLNAEGNSWEYPLWILTRECGLSGPRFEHLDVLNISRSAPVPPFLPDLIVVVTNDGKVSLEGR